MSLNGQVIFDSVEQIIDLGKDSVIDLAISYLEKAGFTDIEPDQFDRLSVQTDGSDLQVVFDRSIQYFPMNTYVIHTAVVGIMYPTTSWQPYDQKKSKADPLRFYTYTDEDKKIIDSILSHKNFCQARLILFMKKKIIIV